MVTKTQVSEVMKALSRKAAKARKAIPPEKRKELASKAAKARWAKK
jgi:hypothetical protein